MGTKTIRIRAKNINDAYIKFRNIYHNRPINYNKTIIMQKATSKNMGLYQIEYINKK